MAEVVYGDIPSDDTREKANQNRLTDDYTDQGWRKYTDYAHKFTPGNGCVHVHEIFFDGVRLPQTPARISIKNTDNTEIITLNNGDPFTLLKKDGVKVIEFEFKLTDRVYPYQWHTSDAEHSKDYWELYFSNKKLNQEPIDLCILRVEYDQYFKPVVLCDYSFTEDAEDHDDFTVSVTLKEFHPQNNQELDTEVVHHLTKNRVNAGWRSGRGE